MPRPRQKVSIFSLAKEFEVTAPTISKALSNNKDVSSELRRKVRERAEELGFRPARPRRKVPNICVLLDLEFDDAFHLTGYAEAVVEGVYHFCSKKGLEFSLFAQKTERLEEIDLTAELHMRHADGAVVVGGSDNRSYFENLRRNRFPFICVYDGPPDSTITVDNVSAGRLAFEHLYSLGHRQIAIARQRARRAAAVNRFVGFMQEAERVQLPLRDVTELIPEDPSGSYDWGRELLQQWCKDGRPWTAIFCPAENVALGLLSEAAIRGIRIPDELSVLTCDNLVMCQQAAPPLSVVDIPNQPTGYAAAEQVWSWISGYAPWQKIIGPKRLPVASVIHRASSASTNANERLKSPHGSKKRQP